MFTAWWLAIAGLPVFLQPLPDAPPVPAAVAVASGQVSRRLPCYRLDCPDAQWQAPSTASLTPGVPPGSKPAIAAVRPASLATRRFIALRSPVTQRDWFYTTRSRHRYGPNYAFAPLQGEQAQLRMEVGTGVRLEPYTDQGTNAPGPIARGQLQYLQRIGEKARLSQQFQVETGRENTFARQIIALDWEVYPQWMLESSLILRHDTAADGGDGRTDRESSVRLRYAF